MPVSRSPDPGSLVPPADWACEGSTDGGTVPWGFLLLATLVGAMFRLYGLTAQSLWVDELLTWHMVRPAVPAGYVEQVLDSIQGALYTAVVWPLVRIEPSALTLRLPAVAAGIAAIPLFGMLAGRLVGGRAGLVAVLLFALNPFHLWYSQEARGYAFLILFSILMGLAYLFLARVKTIQAACWFALAMAASAWSNLSGLFLWAAMGLGVLLFDFPRRPREVGVWTLAFVAALLLVSPWLLKASGIWAVDRVIPGAGTGEALRGETTFTFLAWPYTIQTFFYGYSFGPSLRELHEPDLGAVVRRTWPLLAAGVLPVTVGLVTGLFRPGRRRGLLLVWIVVPVLVLTVLALRNVKPWNPRYVAMVFPWVLILASRGLTGLPRRAGLAATVLLIGLTLWSLGGYFGDDRYAKADVRAAAAHLTEANGAGDVMIVPVVTSVFEFYYQGAGPVVDTYQVPPLADAREADEFLADALGGRDRAWIVLAREWFFDPGDRLPVALARTGHLRTTLTAPGVRVFEWTAKEGSSFSHE